MKNQDNLFNAAVVGENPDTAFLVEGKHLHAVEQRIADQKRDQSDPKKILPLLQGALEGLTSFAQGKVEPHFLEENDSFSSNEQEHMNQLIQKIQRIYMHLPHHIRNDLSSHIHHKSASSR